MKFKTLIDLIGHSVHYPDVKATLKTFGVQDVPRAEMQSYGLLNIPKIHNEETSIEIEFTTRVACQDLKSSFTEDKYELIVNSIMFSKLSPNKLYPFSLNLGEEAKIVSKKLDCKPFRKNKGYSMGFVYWYYKESFEIIAYFDDKLQLEGLWVQLQDVFARKSARLKASLSEQQGNMTIKHLDTLKLLSTNLPTKDWQKRMAEDSEEGEASPFTTKNIYAAELVLKEFINALEVATEKKKASQVQASIKKAVIAFNKLNPKNNYFIETLEREELVDFMTKAVSLTGFKIEEGADITEDWREW